MAERTSGDAIADCDALDGRLRGGVGGVVAVYFIAAPVASNASVWIGDGFIPGARYGQRRAR